MEKTLKRTPLYSSHLALGARLTAFAGWEMPVTYTSIIEEHQAVRSRAGLFDVSHLARFQIRGKGAESFLQRLITTDVRRLVQGRCCYTLLCKEDGGIVDDMMLFRLGEDAFWLVSNAANRAKVWEWLNRWKSTVDQLSLQDISEETIMMAYQGPSTARHLDSLCGETCSLLPRFGCTQTKLERYEVLVARTGYTGEDGFEFVASSTDALPLWNLLLQMGAKPCGLGARDSLRLEAGLLLYGNDIDEGINPYQARLGRLVHLEKGDFVGHQALKTIKEAGIKQCLVGFEMIGRGIARSGHPILASDQEIGRVTSGGYAPSLRRSIGLGYVPTLYTASGTRFLVGVRGRPVEAQVTILPFYRPQAGGQG
ncbi:MAG: glycine cleavage system aminomethyltransferase GcvT [Chloroflexi bacterium]|nr:glycine cleavage system aminomethyltransferase GcvT [Chloroflexota bacterium]